MQVADATALFVNCFGFMSQLPLCSMAGRAVEVARVSLVGGGSYPLTLCSWNLLQCVSVSKGSTFSARSLPLFVSCLTFALLLLSIKYCCCYFLCCSARTTTVEWTMVLSFPVPPLRPYRFVADFADQ